MDAQLFFGQVREACQEMPHLAKLLSEYSGMNCKSSLIEGSDEDYGRLRNRYESAASLRRRGLCVIDLLPNIRWAMCLRRLFIDAWGVRGIAASLDVSPRTVWNYRREAFAWIDTQVAVGKLELRGIDTLEMR